MTAAEIQKRLQHLADPGQAAVLQRFFKTGPGQYGEGDRFLGIRVPHLRKLVQEFGQTPLAEVKKLLKSPIHEARLLALLILVRKFGKADGAGREAIYRLYLGHTRWINNWDLVDASAEHVVGAWLAGRSRKPLDKLARSKALWERRIALLATFHFIKRGEFGPTLQIAAMLLEDDQDLIHKAAGWMLREVGKRDRAALEAFLQEHYRVMPRTMLRYAIERLPEARRKAYLRGTA